MHYMEIGFTKVKSSINENLVTFSFIETRNILLESNYFMNVESMIWF